MEDLASLMARRAELERQIAEAKPAAVAAVRSLMQQLGVTWADLGVTPVATLGKPPKKRKVKYRDAVGNTWTGVGQRPRWLQEAILKGASLESFRVQE